MTVSLKDRLAKAYREGAEIGFGQGRQAAERFHNVLLAKQREQIRAELAKDAQLARFETVTELLTGMISQLSRLDGKVD